MRFRRRDDFLFWVMLTICVASCAAVFHNVANRREALAADNAVKQKAIADVERSTAGADVLQQKINDLQTTVEAFDRSLPRQENLTKVMDGLKALAAEHSLKADRVEPLTASPAADEQSASIDSLLPEGE